MGAPPRAGDTMHPRRASASSPSAPVSRRRRPHNDNNDEEPKSATRATTMKDKNASSIKDAKAQATATATATATSLSSSPCNEIESTYISLIQQYLSVLCYDNAIFLAERFVAHQKSNPRSDNTNNSNNSLAVYLLAMAYYHSGSPKRARSVLLTLGIHGGGSLYERHGDQQHQHQQLRQGQYRSRSNMNTNVTNSNGIVNDDDDDDYDNYNDDIENATRYLLAKCCFDLKLYGEAEECLLKTCRDQFRSIRNGTPAAAAGGGAGAGGRTGGNNYGAAAAVGTSTHYNPHQMSAKGGNAGGFGGDNIQKEMDNWIVHTTPCPIPNGAVGLNLLGSICRRSNRRRRAIEYYRMSLKLDPMLWTSYEALCEMGAMSDGERDVDDPVSVFGVLPAEISRIYGEVDIQESDVNGDDAQMMDKSSSRFGDDVLSSPPAFSLSQTPVGVGEHSIHHARRVRGKGHQEPNLTFSSPSTPFYGRSMMMGEDSENEPEIFSGRGGRGLHTSRTDQPHLPATSLFGPGGKHPPTASKSMSSVDPSRTNLPSTSLFNTPGLTPIEKSEPQHLHTTQASRDNNYRSSRYPSSSTKFPGEHMSTSAASRDLHGAMDSARIASTNSMIARAAAGISLEGGGGQSRLSSSTFSEDVLNRARQVAARLYYAPSPESTPPHGFQDRSSMASSLKLRTRHRCRLGGLGMTRDDEEDGSYDTSNYLNITRATTQSRLSFSSSSANTPTGNRPESIPNSSMITTATVTPLGPSRFAAIDVAADRNEEKDVRSMPAFDNRKGSSGNGMDQEPALMGHQAGGGFTSDYENCDTNKDGGVQEILRLLCTLGAAHRLLCQYRCQEALQIFHQLPFAQFNSGWVQHQVGRAYFEMADYQNAQRALETMQQCEPHRMKGLEVLSTTLWHLKKEVELSYLAQRAVDFDRMSPEAWCVVGNCFSLQKEHETALTFFRRSIQLDPEFTYSHTLSGHEYVSNEDFDKAVACFRDAIRADDRHYNAWYGLGAIYFRQEKYDLAEYHFQKALSINPQSSVLHCHLGMAQHANGKPYEALDTLSGAFRLDPRNPQARYQRATIWMSLDRPHEALAELEKVRDAAPREASVHFSMGRVLKRMGRPEQAMRCFLTALDLDPKDNNLIKAAMDRLDEPDVEEDVSAF